MEETAGKLILAILQEDDYDITVKELNKNGVFVTKLSSYGGFLKKKSNTILIGAKEEEVDKIVSIIKEFAGKRKQKSSSVPAPLNDGHCVSPDIAIPIDVEVGGATIFVMSMDKFLKL